jgi:cell division septal protein FtsQ
VRIGPGFGLAAAAGAALLAAAISEAPRVLRRVAVFEVRNVEVRGLRHLAPHQALATAGIRRGANLFDDSGPWRAALAVHPLVESVEIRRRIPATLVLEVREAEPVLLVATPALVPVDASGRVLPISPGHGSLDLPVLRGEATLKEGRLAGPALLAAVAAFDRIRRLDPALASRVSEVSAHGSALALRLRRPADLAVLMDGGAAPEQLRRLRVVLDEVERAPEGARVGRIDARYDGQVVVAVTGRPGERR